MARKTGASGRQGRTDIELEISDFGPIARGKIALRPLTVFVGPNGSGKSYASVLAHSVLSACADLSAAARSGDWAALLLEDGEFTKLSSRAASLAAHGNGRGKVPPGLRSKIHDRTVRRLFERSLLSHMLHNFGSPLGGLVRVGSASSRIRIGGPLRADMAISRAGATCVKVSSAHTQNSAGGMVAEAGNRARNAARNPKRAPGNGQGDTGIHARDRGTTALLDLAAGIAGHAAAACPSGASNYLPAARSGVMCAHGALAPGILGGLRHGGNGGIGVAGTVSDLAHSLAGAREAPRNGGPDFGGKIIPDVLGGRLDVRGRDAPSYSRGGTSVPIHMSSSGLAGTAPLALAVSGMGPGDTLIVEEPEAHLHPQSQVRLAGHLVSLVRRGMRVILSTHSPFLLEQLGMFVQLGALSPSRRRRTGYGKDEYVEIDEAAAYAFGGSAKGGHTISEIERSADFGIPQDEFVRVSEAMSRDESRLHYAREK